MKTRRFISEFFTNLPMGFLMKFMNTNSKELYGSNITLIEELKKNPIIMEHLLENVYVDKGLKKLIAIDQNGKGNTEISRNVR